MQGPKLYDSEQGQRNIFMAFMSHEKERINKILKNIIACTKILWKPLYYFII